MQIEVGYQAPPESVKSSDRLAIEIEQLEKQLQRLEKEYQLSFNQVDTSDENESGPENDARQISKAEKWQLILDIQAQLDWYKILQAARGGFYPEINRAAINYFRHPKSRPRAAPYLEPLTPTLSASAPFIEHASVNIIRHRPVCATENLAWLIAHGKIDEEQRHAADRKDDIAFNPACPSLYQGHESTSYEPTSKEAVAIDDLLIDQIAKYLRAFQGQAHTFSPGTYAQAFFGTRIPNLDARTALAYKEDLPAHYRTPKAKALATYLVRENQLYFPDPETFAETRGQSMIAHLNHYTDGGTNRGFEAGIMNGHSQQAYQRATFSRFLFEHDIHQEYDQAQHGDSLFHAYTDLLAWLQIGCPRDPLAFQTKIMAAYKGLLTGVSHHYQGPDSDTSYFIDTLDYVDAAFLSYSEILLAEQWQNYTRHENFYNQRRATYSANPLEHLGQMALIIARLWLCASDEQKIRYQDKIKAMFAHIDELMHGQEVKKEADLFVTTCMTHSEIPRVRVYAPDSVEMILDSLSQNRVACLMNLAIATPYVHPRQGASVRLEIPDHHGHLPMTGYMADHFTLEDGIYVWHDEPVQKKEQPAAIREVEKSPAAWPEFDMRAEARGEITRTHAELSAEIEASPRLGTDLLTRLVTMMEMLIGNDEIKITELKELLHFMSSVNALAGLIPHASSDELRQIKEDFDKITPAGFDELCAQIYLTAMIGIVPKELLLELSYRTITNLVAFQALDVTFYLEKRERDKRFIRRVITHEEDFISPILELRARLQTLAEEIQTTQPGQAVIFDTTYQTQLLAALEEVMTHLYLNKSYDFSLHSLFQVLLLAKRKNQELHSRCATDAKLMIALTHLLSSVAQVYALHTLGPEGRSSIEAFQAALSKGEIGAASHLRMLSPLFREKDPESPAAYAVADATINELAMRPPRKVKILETKTQAMQAGFGLELDWKRSVYGHRGMETCLALQSDALHSPLGASIAAEAHYPEVALILLPDDPSLLLFYVVSLELSPALRRQALEKLIKLEPRFLAFNVSDDKKLSALHFNLKEVMNLALETQDYQIILYCANILRFHKRAPAKAKKLAEKMSAEAISVLALDDYKLAAQTSQYPELVFPDDKARIAKKKQQHSKTLARLAKKDPPQARTYHQDVNQAMDKALVKDISELGKIAMEMYFEELAALMSTPKDQREAGEQIRLDIDEEQTPKQKTLLANSSEGTHPAQDHFEIVPPEIAAKYLSEFTTGPGGEALSPNELAQRLFLIQIVARETGKTFAPDDPAFKKILAAASVRAIEAAGHQALFTEEQLLADEMPLIPGLLPGFDPNEEISRILPKP